MQKQDRASLIDAVLFNLAFLMIIWALWLYEYETGHRLSAYGTRPRTPEGAIGILTTPFLHGSLKHIWGNTVSFFTLSTFIIFFYREIAFKTILIIYLVSGVLLWAFGGGGNHIGVSGVIYGMAAFLFFSGIVRKNQKLLRVALAVAFLYGSIVWWVLPIDPQISWEGHLAGSIVGIVLAILLRNQGPQAEKTQWEIEEELELEEALESEGELDSEGEFGDQTEGSSRPPRQGGGFYQSDSTDGDFFW